MRRSLTGFCLAVSMALVACGTTVPQAETVAGSQPGLDGTGLGLSPTGSASGAQGLGAEGFGGSGAVAFNPDGPANSPAAGVNPTGRGGSGTKGTVTGSTSAPTSTSKARGVTDSTIKIGMPVATGEEALANTFGISGFGSLSPKDAMKAVVNDVNNSGGVLGRNLELYVHEFDAASGVANPEQTAAAICSDFRDDRPVFAVLFDITIPSLRKCLADMGSPLLVQGGFSVMPASAYADYGGSFLYGVNAITTERLAELFISSLVERSFHDPWNTTAGGPGAAPVKLGVIHVDTPDSNALYAAYGKELAKHGLKFADTVTYPPNAQDGVSATQSAVLRFRSNGITHVYGASAFFLQAAESQGYRPRYAYIPGLGRLGVANVPAAQMRGALTVGWTPASDVDRVQDPGDTPRAKHCRQVMTAASLDTANRDDLKTMYGICDAVHAFRVALSAGQAPTVAGLRRGYEALGTGFGTALTFGASLGPNRHNGVDSVRDMAFDSRCECLKYTSKTNRS